MKSQLFIPFICLLVGASQPLIGQQLLVRPNDTTTMYLMVEPQLTNFGAFYGVDAGRMNVGSYNTLIGWGAGAQNRTGEANTFIGEIAGEANRTGSNNSYLGRGAGRLSKGSNNTFMGSDAGAVTTLGAGNTFIGKGAGAINNGNNNVFLGLNAGASQSGSNKLFIENTDLDSANALIYGRFDINYLRANAKTEVYSTSINFPAFKGVKSHAPGILTDEPGVLGQNTVVDYWGIGVLGRGGYIGVKGEVTGSSNGAYIGMHGLSNSPNNGTNYGLLVEAGNAATNYGIYSVASGGLTNYAGYFQGNLFASGNVGIGTTVYATGYKLSVDGKIACEEVLVDLSGDWPDYVFESSYNLTPLDELRSFISHHGHLPGIPSAAEVKEKGIELGEMNKALLQKIEELTLYILDQEKRIQKMEAKLSAGN